MNKKNLMALFINTFNNQGLILACLTPVIGSIAATVPKMEEVQLLYTTLIKQMEANAKMIEALEKELDPNTKKETK